MSKDPLLQPFQLKSLVLKNRIVTTPHEPAYCEDGLPKERYRAYHLERAKGGVAMAMTAGSAIVSRDSPPAFNNILAYRDEVVPWIRDLTDALHEHDTKVMIQLTHLGRRTGWNKGDWLPSLSSTRLQEPAHRAFPKLAEDWDFARIVDDFASAAARMKEGGMDGIELEAYGHLIDQLWSPLTNQLEGEYGPQTLDSRMRLGAEVLGAMRKAVGPDFVLGIRMAVDEAEAGGVTADDGLEIARRLRDAGLIDYISVIRGRIHTDAALTDVIPVQGMRAAPHLDFAGRVRAELGMPTIHAARIPDVATARHAVAAGLLDLVGMTRAHLADPHIVRKIAEGREDDIRPCVGATYCLDRIYQGGEALCIHNAASGRELSMPHRIPPADQPKSVMIIGAGPAGLEAARVAAERGHCVSLHEAAAQPGGQLRLTARSPRRREMISIIDWRMAQCEAKGVTLQFNHFVEPEDVLEAKPDLVIVATGGLADTDCLESGESHVVSAWDILSGDVDCGSDVLVFDDAGDHAGLQAAEMIAEKGGQVEIMTPDRSFAPEVMGMNLVPYMRALQDKETRFTVTYRLKTVRKDGNRLIAGIGTDYSDYRTERSFDQIVVNHATVPLDDLYHALKPHSTNGGEVDHDALLSGRPQALARNPSGSFQLFRIGDAVSPRNTHAAIYDALRLMKDL
ncbi:NADH:flavin oxidoreductase [Paracoccus zhejiangensis]|uniref:N-methylproline demethylase n=1 Tax=Paracoccus zhejiangensis TaxID=1077935 RepID=A0A2H5F376_9RHOB|nr:NADH:flavin oxidoreductase [Paracoccus zhejiangensis]AUH66000.1 N-methylproline demethylase [Paracoccus zhejiangensis]